MDVKAQWNIDKDGSSLVHRTKTEEEDSKLLRDTKHAIHVSVDENTESVKRFSLSDPSDIDSAFTREAMNTGVEDTDTNSVVRRENSINRHNADSYSKYISNAFGFLKTEYHCDSVYSEEMGNEYLLKSCDQSPQSLPSSVINGCDKICTCDSTCVQQESPCKCTDYVFNPPHSKALNSSPSATAKVQTCCESIDVIQEARGSSAAGCLQNEHCLHVGCDSCRVKNGQIHSSCSCSINECDNNIDDNMTYTSQKTSCVASDGLPCSNQKKVLIAERSDDINTVKCGDDAERVEANIAAGTNVIDNEVKGENHLINELLRTGEQSEHCSSLTSQHAIQTQNIAASFHAREDRAVLLHRSSDIAPVAPSVEKNNNDADDVWVRMRDNNPEVCKRKGSVNRNAKFIPLNSSQHGVCTCHNSSVKQNAVYIANKQENEERLCTCCNTRFHDNLREVNDAESITPSPLPQIRNLDSRSSSVSSDDTGDSSDEDSGIYAESYRNSCWIHVDDDGNLVAPSPVPEKKRQSAAVRQASSDISSIDDDVFDGCSSPLMERRYERSDSNATTVSEKEFRVRYQSINKRFIQRKDSQQEFFRFSTAFYEAEKVLIIAKETGDGMCQDFGLHIFASHPAVISKVDPGSAAELAGAEQGHIIIAVNNINVLEAKHEEIVNLMRKNPDVLKLEIGQSDVFHSRDLQAHVKEGYLYKLGNSGLIKLWRRRWFVLRQDNCLYYYKSSGAQDALGAVPLANYSITKTTETNRPFSFKAEKGGARLYYLAAESEQDMNSWAQLMLDAAKCPLKRASWMDITMHNVSIPALSIRNPECVGYMLKLNSKKVWNKRYCILKDGCIYYYKNINSVSAQGVVHLHGYLVDGSSLTGKKHSFTLKPPEEQLRKFCFCAENDTDRERWTSCMKRSISRWIQVTQ